MSKWTAIELGQQLGRVNKELADYGRMYPSEVVLRCIADAEARRAKIMQEIAESGDQEDDPDARMESALDGMFAQLRAEFPRA